MTEIVVKNAVNSTSLLEAINNSIRASEYLLGIAHRHRIINTSELIAEEVKSLSLLKKMVDPPTIRMIRED